MILIFGGAYQGKLEYALQRFGLAEDDVIFCADGETALPTGRKIICGIDKWILSLIRADSNITHEASRFINQNPGAIIICNDISCGVVPTCPVMRKWREEVGRFLGRLARQSNEVVRLYCGIPTILKGA